MAEFFIPRWKDRGFKPNILILSFPERLDRFRGFTRSIKNSILNQRFHLRNLKNILKIYRFINCMWERPKNLEKGELIYRLAVKVCFHLFTFFRVNKYFFFCSSVPNRFVVFAENTRLSVRFIVGGSLFQLFIRETFKR